MSKILQIPLDELEINIVYSGRTEKEINANAKELVEVKAKGWDEAQPGQVFKRDDKWHLAAGFTRRAAALAGGHKTGYFIEIPDEPARLRSVAIRSNSGKPISSLAKGHIFLAMRAGSDVEKLAAGEVALPPMTSQEIADEVGCTRQMVDTCIALAESCPEIQEMIEAGLVATSIVKRSRELAKGDEKLQIKALKAAIRKAKEDGKETATMQHFDAIKAEVFPLKAAPSKKDEIVLTDTPLETTKDSVTAHEEGNEPEQQDNEPKKQAPAPQSSLDLGEPTPKKTDPKAKRDATISALEVLINKHFDDSDKPNEELALALAEFLADSGVSAPMSPL